MVQASRKAPTPYLTTEERTERRQEQIQKINEDVEFGTLLSVPYAKAFASSRVDLVVFSMQEVETFCMESFFCFDHHVMVSDFGTILKPLRDACDEKEKTDKICECCFFEKSTIPYPRKA